MVLLVNNVLKTSKSFGLRLQEYSAIFLKYNSKNNLNKFVSSGNIYGIRFASNCRAALLKETNKSIVIEEVQPKRLGKNQVRIATHTCALNASDVLMCQGVSRIQPQLPFVPGYEIAGEILELNIEAQPAKKSEKKKSKDKAKKCDKDDDDDDDDDDDIIPLAVGDRVIGLSRENLGGFSEECIVDYKDVWRLPASLDFVTAVGLVDTYSLALLGLFRRANIQNCDHVLVTAGAGGLGTAAVDIAANVYKSKVIAVCNSEGCAEQLRNKGAWSAITYSDKQLIQSVKDITKKRGVDIVFETIGGGVFESAIRSVAPEGKVIIGGFASQQIPDIPMSELLTLPSFSLIGVSLRNYRETKFKVYRQIVDDVLQLSQQGLVTPLVSKTFKLNEVNDALQHIKETEEIGKVVLVIDK